MNFDSLTRFLFKTNYKRSTHKFKGQELLVLEMLYARHILKNTSFWMVDGIFQERTGELSVPTVRTMCVSTENDFRCIEFLGNLRGWGIIPYTYWTQVGVPDILVIWCLCIVIGQEFYSEHKINITSFPRIGITMEMSIYLCFICFG